MQLMRSGCCRLVAGKPGDTVTGGTVSYEAPVTITATSTGSSSTLAGIGRCVRLTFRADILQRIQ
jgi:cation transport ATPase